MRHVRTITGIRSMALLGLADLDEGRPMTEFRKLLTQRGGLIQTYMDSWREVGVAAGDALNEAYRRRLRGEPNLPRPVERFDFTRPPPGHFWDPARPGYVRQRTGKLRLLADAWARWKSKRFPPGVPEVRGDDAARSAAWAAYEANL